MRTFWLVSAVANALVGFSVVWLVMDAGDGLLGRDYQPAVIPTLGVCMIGILARLLGQTRAWTVVPVLCVDLLALTSMAWAIRRWPSGDDGRGLAFLLIVGGMLSAIVLADAIAAVVIATEYWSRKARKWNRPAL